MCQYVQCGGIHSKYMYVCTNVWNYRYERRCASRQQAVWILCGLEVKTSHDFHVWDACPSQACLFRSVPSLPLARDVLRAQHPRRLTMKIIPRHLPRQGLAANRQDYESAAFEALWPHRLVMIRCLSKSSSQRESRRKKTDYTSMDSWEFRFFDYCFKIPTYWRSCDLVFDLWIPIRSFWAFLDRLVNLYCLKICVLVYDLQ